MGVPFLPATNLFFRVGFVVAERVLFIPVAGYSLIFVYGLERLNYKLPNCNKVFSFTHLNFLIEKFLTPEFIF